MLWVSQKQMVLACLYVVLPGAPPPPLLACSSVFAPFCSAKATHPVSLTQGLEEEPGGFSDCRPVSPLSPQE